MTDDTCCTRPKSGRLALLRLRLRIAFASQQWPEIRDMADYESRRSGSAALYDIFRAVYGYRYNGNAGKPEMQKAFEDLRSLSLTDLEKAVCGLQIQAHSAFSDRRRIV